MAILVRYWQDGPNNLTYQVSYQSGNPRQIVTTVTPTDPAYPVGPAGGPPTDGITAGTVLYQACEGLDQVTVTATDSSPYAVITVIPNASACDNSTLAIVRATGYAPVSPATTGRGEVQTQGGVPPYAVTVAGTGYSQTITADANGLAAFPNLAPGSYSVSVTDYATPAATRTASFVVPQTTVNGCTLPEALNYNPSANTNDGSCVFVAIDAQPSNLVAAHLPVPVLMRAAPIQGQPGIVYLYLETSANLTGPWAPAGQLRQGADPTTAAVAFNISEILKAQFSINPPTENGVDPSLSFAARLRYVVQSASGTPTYAGTLNPFRALNAIVTIPTSGVLTTPTPYTSQPVNAALWRNTATLSGGVVAEVLPIPATGCATRCFVWLNPAGGWQTGFFSGRHIHATDQADPVIFRDQYGADRYARRGIVRPTLQVYSDLLTYDTYYALRGIRDSIQVYERTGAYSYATVLVSSGSYSEYQEQTDKTYTVDFTVSYPPVLVQTQ